MKLMATHGPRGMDENLGLLGWWHLQSTMYAPFAQYFVKICKPTRSPAYPVDYISLQNEPLFVPTDYPGMCIPPSPGGKCGGVASPTDQATASEITFCPRSPRPA